MKKSMDQTFWDQQHTVSNQTWLTGSTVDAYLGFFDLTRDDLTNQKILEIGVGLGRASRELAELAKEFYCADISQVALDKLSDSVAQRFLTKDLHQVPEVDLVICHLVTVHCVDAEVIRILDAIALSENGRIFMQFSGPRNDGEISERARQIFADDGSHHFRTTQDVRDLVGKTNKKIHQFLPSKTVYHDGWFDHDWHPVIITNT